MADTDAQAGSRGELLTTSRDLSDLMGRPTTTLAAAIASAPPP
jgi:hypothetical protein